LLQKNYRIYSKSPERKLLFLEKGSWIFTCCLFNVYLIMENHLNEGNLSILEEEALIKKDLVLKVASKF